MTQSNPRWLCYLPAFLRNKIQHRPNLLAILSNSGWLFADRILRIGVGLVVGVWIARYLGPEQFGLWSYAIAFTALFGAFATLGLDGIVIRELVKNPERKYVLLGTSFVLKLLGGILALFFALLAVQVARPNEPFTLLLIGLSSAGFIFQSLNVIDFYFQAKVTSKYTVYAANTAFILTTLLKIILLLSAAPLIAFAWAGLMEIVLTTIFLFIAYRVNHQTIRSWYYDSHVAKGLLNDSWPLIISSLAVMIYARVDQLMIPIILNDFELGVFSASVRITEAWLFLPMIIASSALPNLIELRKVDQLAYERRLLSIYSLVASIAIFVACFVTFFASEILNILFGADYIRGVPVLKIRIWETVFAAIGVISGNWILIEGLQKKALIFSVLGMLINVALNIILIPHYGIKGAAVSSLISIFFVIIILPLFVTKMRVDVHRRLLALIIWPKIFNISSKFKVG